MAKYKRESPKSEQEYQSWKKETSKAKRSDLRSLLINYLGAEHVPTKRDLDIAEKIYRIGFVEGQIFEKTKQLSTLLKKEKIINDLQKKLQEVDHEQHRSFSDHPLPDDRDGNFCGTVDKQGD